MWESIDKIRKRNREEDWAICQRKVSNRKEHKQSLRVDDATYWGKVKERNEITVGENVNATGKIVSDGFQWREEALVYMKN